MRRDQLEHAIRTACQIIGHDAVVVVGSQAILGSFTRTNFLPKQLCPPRSTSFHLARTAPTRLVSPT